MSAPTAADFEALREVETEWLATELGNAIANLGYPVGCGIAPHPETLRKAATKLFDRYAKMIELARNAGDQSAIIRDLIAALEALAEASGVNIGGPLIDKARAVIERANAALTSAKG